MINHGYTNESTNETAPPPPTANHTQHKQASDKKPQTEQQTEISRFRSALPQILASSAKNLILMDLGMTIAFPTIVIPALLGNVSGKGMYFSTSDASWFGSIAFICQPLGSILSGIVLEPLGRKCSLLIVNFPHIFGWLLFYSATTVRTIFIANIILGLGVGFMEAPIITYVGEICEPSLRGILISYSNIFFSTGVVFITVLGNITDWQTTALISTLVPIITVIAITQVPETPYWLLSRGRVKDAEKSLCWLRGWVKPDAVQKELQEMIQYSDASKYNRNKSGSISDEKNVSVGYSNPAVSLDDEKEKSDRDGKKDGSSVKNGEFVTVDLSKGGNERNKSNNKMEKIGLIEQCKDLTRPGMLKPLALVLSFFFVINFAAVAAIRPYQVRVFAELGFPIDAYRAVVVMSVNAFVGTVLCMVLVPYLGKRRLSLISLFAVTICIFVLCVYSKLYLQYQPNIETATNWFPFVTYFILQFFFSFGVSPVPWMLVSEVFPYRGRSQASGFSAACSYVFSFIATKTFLGLEQTLTLSGVLSFYGICSLSGLVGLYIYMPETEGRSLQEIEDSYKSKTKEER